MLQAALWGLAANAALMLGAVLAPILPIRDRALGLLMAFAGGALVSAVAFELAAPGIERAGVGPLATGLAVGALLFYAGDRVITGRGGGGRKDIDGSPPETGAGRGSSALALALALGVLLDGVPESAAIGIGLAGDEGVGIALVGAVFVSGFPESLASARSLSAGGRSYGYVVGFWAVIAALCVLATVLGFELLGSAPDTVVAGVEGIAAGAILVMLADTLFPEAYEHGGPVVGLATAIGFVLALVLAEL